MQQARAAAQPNRSFKTEAVITHNRLSSIELMEKTLLSL